jgi:hypothetical protein
MCGFAALFYGPDARLRGHDEVEKFKLTHYLGTIEVETGGMIWSLSVESHVAEECRKAVDAYYHEVSGITLPATPKAELIPS